MPPPRAPLPRGRGEPTTDAGRTARSLPPRNPGVFSAIPPFAGGTASRPERHGKGGRRRGTGPVSPESGTPRRGRPSADTPLQQFWRALRPAAVCRLWPAWRSIQRRRGVRVPRLVALPAQPRLKRREHPRFARLSPSAPLPSTCGGTGSLKNLGPRGRGITRACAFPIPRPLCMNAPARGGRT